MHSEKRCVQQIVETSIHRIKYVFTLYLLG